MSSIIGVIQLKGGAGRSTLATNLAAALGTRATTVLVDCDLPQGTSAAWWALRSKRAEAKGAQLTVTTATRHDELVSKVRELSVSNEYVVIDGPPRVAEMTRAIIALADLSLIPLGASAAEIWAVSDLLATIAEARQRGLQVDARIVWNRFRERTRSAREMSQATRQAYDLPELNARLGQRVAYGEALARGMWVGEWHDALARQEMEGLAVEIAELLMPQQPPELPSTQTTKPWS